jgi:hypothetical protein
MQKSSLKIIYRILLLIFLLGNLNILFATIIQVGPNKSLTVPSQAAAIAVDGDTIEIDAAEYLGDVAAWYQNNLYIRGVGTGRPHLRADGNYIMGKGIWVTIGDNIIVDNIEFSEASVPDENGAGIRQDGYGLVVRNCYFHDNENGMLCDGGNLIVEYCEFSNNGFGDGFTHNIYVVDGDTLTFRYNYSHHAIIGHNFKTRSAVNYILYNRIMDENSGTSSYAIDVPNGGLTYVIGNLIQQGPFTDNNGAIIAYGLEGLSGGRTHNLYIVNNTIVNDYGQGGRIFDIAGSTQVSQIINNILVPFGGTVGGSGSTLITNWITDSPNLVQISDFDYRLTANSTGAIDQGTDPGSGVGFNLSPEWHYLHPANRENRTVVNVMDIGAYEYSLPTGLHAEQNQVGKSFKIKPNYPNPFNPKTNISFDFYKPGKVSLQVYDALGKMVARLIDKHMSPGAYNIEFDASELTSGIYYYRLQSRDQVEIGKMLLTR